MLSRQYNMIPSPVVRLTVDTDHTYNVYALDIINRGTLSFLISVMFISAATTVVFTKRVAMSDPWTAWSVLFQKSTVHIVVTNNYQLIFRL